MTESKHRGVKLYTEETEETLNQRQLSDYVEYRKRQVDWMLELGKDPGQAEGYSTSTVQQRSYRLDRFYRWLWTQSNGYTLSVSTDDADEYMRELAVAEHSNTYKASLQKSLKMLFNWLNWDENSSIEWSPDISFSGSGGSANPRDFLTERERKELRSTALEYGSVPSYTSLTPSERKEWKRYLSQKFEKPMAEVTVEDWERANNFKEASIIWTALDAGLRNVEVKRAKVSWIDVENGVLRIPEEDSSKNRDNWIVGLQSRTVNLLEEWLEQRETYEKYQGSDRLWLTKYGNPYSAKGLNRLLDRILDESNIGREDEITWYSIRRSTATYISNEEGLSAAQRQLRHKSPKTTMRYDQVPIEDIKEALNRID